MLCECVILAACMLVTFTHRDGSMTEVENDQKIRIKLISSKGHEVLFQVKPSTKLGTVMRAYCTRLNMRMDTTRFVFDGNRLNEGLLVSQSELEMDDVIDVLEEMVGGGGACV